MGESGEHKTLNKKKVTERSRNDILVLGLDPGSRCTGYGFVRETSGQLILVDAGTIRPGPSKDLAGRLGYIFTGLVSLIEKYRPDEAAVEEVFTAFNSSAALKLGQARGAVLVACTHKHLPVSSYEPTKIKKSLVGVGRADKTQVAFMVGQLLNCKQKWAKDTSDALAVAIAHLNQRKLALQINQC